MSKPKYKYKSYNYPTFYNKFNFDDILKRITNVSRIIDSRASKGRSNYMVVSSAISNFLNNE